MFGIHKEGSRPLASVARRRTWRNAWPTWLVSLVLVGRLFGAVVVILGTATLAKHFVGHAWGGITLGCWMALVFWGYVHELVKAERRLRP